MSVYALNAEQPTVDKELCIPFAWPFDAWECIIPSGAVPKINILEKLILSLISSGAVTTEGELQSFLQKEIGLDAELVENAYALCQEKGYINKERSDLTLNKIGKAILATCEDGVIIDPDYADSRKRVFLFRDLVTGAVVPFFEVDALSRERVNFDTDSGIFLPEKQKSGDKPDTYKRRDAMRTWGRMFSEQIRTEASPSNDMDLDSKPDPDMPIDDEPGKESRDDVKPVPKKDIPAYDLMQLYSDKPEHFHLMGYFVINRYCTSEIKVISPFGTSCDSWFRNMVRRLRIADDAFEDKLVSMVSDRVESLKDKMAFNNDSAIALFDRLPAICNDAQYDELKKRIVIMNDYLADVQHRNTHISSFASAMRQGIEDAAKYALRKHSELEYTRTVVQELYEPNHKYTEVFRKIKTAAPDYNFGPGILDNIRRNRSGECSGAKDAMALMVIDSVEHPEHTEICHFVTSCHDWIKEIPPLITLLNKVSHGEAVRMNKTPEEYYQQAEEIIIDLFEKLIL